MRLARLLTSVAGLAVAIAAARQLPRSRRPIHLNVAITDEDSRQATRESLQRIDRALDDRDVDLPDAAHYAVMLALTDAFSDGVLFAHAMVISQLAGADGVLLGDVVIEAHGRALDVDAEEP